MFYNYKSLCCNVDWNLRRDVSCLRTWNHSETFFQQWHVRDECDEYEHERHEVVNYAHVRQSYTLEQEPKAFEEERVPSRIAVDFLTVNKSDRLLKVYCWTCLVDFSTLLVVDCLSEVVVSLVEKQFWLDFGVSSVEILFQFLTSSCFHFVFEKWGSVHVIKLADRSESHELHNDVKQRFEWC